MDSRRYLIVLVVMALFVLSGCASTPVKKNQSTGSISQEPRQPGPDELTGQWKADHDTYESYVLIKQLGKAKYAVQTWALYNPEEGECKPTAWASVWWDGDVLEWQKGTTWDPTYDPANGTMTIQFEPNREVSYKPARRHPAERCGLKTGRGKGI